MKKKLSKSKLIGYGSGDFALGILINCIIFHLIYFYTDVFYINAVAAGSIILISRILQGFINPYIGNLSDKTETRWGKKRPFILFGALPMGLLFFFIFAPVGIISENNFTYGLITLTLFFIVFSTVMIPYAALPASMTRDSHERSVISAYRMVFSLIGAVIAASCTKPLVSLFTDEAVGFRMVGLIFGIIAAMILLITFSVVREKDMPESKTEELKFSEKLKLIRHNTPFIIIACMSLACFSGMNILAMVINYYFIYVLNAQHFIFFAFITIFAAAGLAAPFFIILANKKGKKNAFLTGLIILFVVMIMAFFLKEAGIWVIFIILFFAGVGISSVFLFPYSLMPDTIEYMEWKTGQRQEGLLYSFFIIFFNLSSALASFIVGITLDITNYRPHETQSDTSIMGIQLLMTFIPAIPILISIILVALYPINEKFHKKIVDDLVKRKLEEING